MESSPPENGRPREYERNFREIVERLNATGATLFRASTTPIREKAEIWVGGADIEYNAIATRIMKQHDVTINTMRANCNAS